MSVTPEEVEVIKKLFPTAEDANDGEDGEGGEKTPDPVKGEELLNRLDLIEDEDLPADSEVRAKLKHFLDDEANTLFTEESLTRKIDVMAKSSAVGLSEKEYLALDGSFKACANEDGGAEIEKAVLLEYILKEHKGNFTPLTIKAWSEVLAPPPPKPEVQEESSDPNAEDPSDEQAPQEDETADETPVLTTITLEALLSSCGDYVRSFKTKMSVEEVAIIKAAVARQGDGPEFPASAFQEALMESKDKVPAEVVEKWVAFFKPLVPVVDPEADDNDVEAVQTTEAAFVAKRQSQNWSSATGLTETEMSVILEAFESLNPDEWYQGGSIGKKELHEYAVPNKLPVCTCSAWADALNTADEATEDSPIQFNEFLQGRQKMVHAAQYRLLSDEVSLAMAAFADLSSDGLDCNATFSVSALKGKLDTSSLSESKKAGWEAILGSTDEVSYFDALAMRSDEQIAYDTGVSAKEARMLRTAFVALDNERDEFLQGKVKAVDLYALLVENGKAAGSAEKLAWSNYLKAASGENDNVDFEALIVERGLQTQEMNFRISKDELKRIREQFINLDDVDSGKVVFTELVSKLKGEYDLLGESMGELWSQLPNHVTGVDKDGKVSLIDFLTGRSEIILMNEGNLTSAEILDIKNQYQHDDTQLDWRDYLLARAPLVVEKRARKTIPVGEDAKKYLMKSKTGERDGVVVTLPDLLIEGCTELCRHKPQGLDAVTWLGQWLLENNPNQPKVEIPDS